MKMQRWTMMVIAVLVGMTMGANWARGADGLDFWHAVEQGDAGRVEELLKGGQDVNELDLRSGMTALGVAAGQGNVGMMRQLIDKGSDINQVTRAGCCAMFYAARNGKKEAVEWLLSQGVNVNRVEEPGHPALTGAVASGDVEIVKWLLKAGADANLGSVMRWGPLHEAGWRGDLEAAQVLVQAGADVRMVTRHGDTALSEAAAMGRVDVLADFCHLGDGSLAPADRGMSRALLQATVGGQEGAVKILVDEIGVPGQSWLYHGAIVRAVERGYTKILEELLRGAGSLEGSSDVMRVAVEARDARATVLLADHGARVEAENRDRFLGYAMETGSKDMCIAIWKASIAEDDEEGQMLQLARASLIDLAWEGETEDALQVIKMVPRASSLKGTASVFARMAGRIDTYRVLAESKRMGGPTTPQPAERVRLDLIESCGKGDAEAVERLLKEEEGMTDAMHHIVDKVGLYEAIDTGGNVKVVELLLNHGRDPSDMGQGREGSALSLAAGKGEIDIVKFLLSLGIDVEDAGGSEYSPLYMAVKGNHPDVVRLLLEHGANLDCRNKRGKTALMWASQEGYAEAAKLLLEHGADALLKDEEGYTAWMLGYRAWWPKVLRILPQPDNPEEAKAVSLGRKPVQTNTAGISYVRELIATGQDLHVRDSLGDLPIERLISHWGYHKDRAEALQMLLKAGADVHEVEGILCMVTDVGIAEVLVEAGADVDEMNVWGMRPLMTAAISQRREMLDFLMAHGANPMLTDRSGRTVIGVLESYSGMDGINKLEMVEYLKKVTEQWIKTQEQRKVEP